MLFIYVCRHIDSPHFLQLTALLPFMRNKPWDSYRQKKKPLVTRFLSHAIFCSRETLPSAPMESPFGRLRKPQGILLRPLQLPVREPFLLSNSPASF